ncbi:PREDICTED: uncharacterized protein LOC109593811 [Amphimedon queenslandica]|uniref:receptor protein-tyrosine kinase n=1 Tax=Amphimedon queenslandica TaxID=400682 RepID=A0AAN0K572_AMPQE|nr:PREDICTED: uncharacterized protein LOC109593811 [Amphimedon queenslandica]|eukprot:XP_019864466.1 PREDICTED: uncharacterized protein LOC109593811 [Amphimedon queenslandica]
MILTFLFVIFLNAALSCGQVVPECPDKGETVCLGHSTSRVSKSIGNTVSDILLDAHEQFCGCRYIKDNLVISIGNSLSDADQHLVEANFSFLYYVREISGYLELSGIPYIKKLSLPSLRLIRGDTLRLSRYGLAVSGRIEMLFMPNLTEISKGDVVLLGNSDGPYLCNVLSVNWTDIAPFGPSGHRFETTGCSDSNIIDCDALNCNSGYCWCNDTSCCQPLTYINCNCNNSQRCYRSDHTTHCCNSECAAGCIGGENADQCRACKNVLDDGVCLEECLIQEPPNVNNKSNSDLKFEAKPLCLSSCPDVLFEFGTICVESCPANYTSVPTSRGTMKCIPCDKVCFQECVGGIFDYSNPGAYAGCMIITTSLRIGSIPVGTNNSILNVLKDIIEIRGSLDISSFSDKTFPYLSNLKAVGTNSVQVLSTQSCQGLSEYFNHSIIVSDTSLVSIDLSSLETVSGGIRLHNNPSLHDIGNLCYYLINDNASLSSSCVLDNHRLIMNECAITSVANDNCSSCIDLTRTPEANGSSVVATTIHLIHDSEIFEDDCVTLKRIAWLETHDGTNQLTYRPYHHGGIWNVNETSFNNISPILAHGNGIWRVFGINWKNVTWTDLRKPLYSALAARLLIHQITNGASLCQISTQANMWSSTYTSSRKTVDYYLKLNSELNVTQQINITQIGLGTSDLVNLSSNEWAYFSLNVSENISLIIVSLLVDVGKASLYVSNIGLPSDSFHCAQIKETSENGYVYLSLNQFSSYGSQDILFIGVVGHKNYNMTTASLSLNDAQNSYNFVQNLGSDSEWFAIGIFGNKEDVEPLPFSIFVTSDSNETFNISVESYSGQIMTAKVKPFETTKFSLSHLYTVTNVNDTLNGLIIKAEGGHRIRVSVRYFSSDSYLALPLIKYDGVTEYTYIAVTPTLVSPGTKSKILIVCGFNDTSVTIIPSGTALVYSPHEGLREIEYLTNITILAMKFQTILVESDELLIGTKVVTSKPVTFLSGHQCVSKSGSMNESCEFTIEQIPPTVNWGQNFIFSSLPSSNDSRLSITAAEPDTKATISCDGFSADWEPITISNPSGYIEIVVNADDNFCSIVADKPSMVMVVSSSTHTERSMMSLVHPIEQYSDANYTFAAHSTLMGEDHLNLILDGNVHDVLLNDEPVIIQTQFLSIQGRETFRYGLPLELDNVTYSVSIKNGARVGTMLYGFDQFLGYGQLTATSLYMVHKSNNHLSVNVTSHIVQYVAGDNIVLMCSTSGLPVYAIHWMKEDSIIYPSCKLSISSCGPNSSMLNVYNIDPSDAGVYQCIAHSYYSHSVAASAQLSVIEPSQDNYKVPVVMPAIPNPTWTVKNRSHCLSFNISNAVPNVTSNHIWWHHKSFGGQEKYLDPSDTSKYSFSSNNHHIMVKEPQIHDSGNYTMIVRNEAGITNNTITFNVYVAATIFGIPPFNLRGQDGESVTYACIADGVPRPEITWTKDGVSLENSKRIFIMSEERPCCEERLELMSTLTINELNSEIDNGTYSCRANNAVQQEAVLMIPFSLNVLPPTQIDRCTNNPCGQFGSCSNKLHTYYCTCHGGYTGDRCQYTVLAFVEPQFTETPKDTIANLYSAVNLTCRATGSPNPVIVWYKDDDIIINNNDDISVLKIPELRLSNRGFYHCEARTWHNEKMIIKTSDKALVRIKGVVQYETLIKGIESSENILLLIRSSFSSQYFPGNTKLLNVDISNDSSSLEAHYRVIVTLLTDQKPSNILALSLYDQLQSSPEISIIQIERFDGCMPDTTIIPPHTNVTDLNVTITWNETELGSDVQVHCPCGNGNASMEFNLTATRTCQGNFKDGAMWKEPNVSSCNISDFAREICRLTEFPLSERVMGLVNLTDENSHIADRTDVTIITEVLLTTTTVVRGNFILTESYLNVVDYILGINMAVLQQSQISFNTSARILASIEPIIAEIPLTNLDEPVFIVFENFATSVIEIETEQFDGLTSTFDANNSRIEYTFEFKASTTTLHSISLPSDLLSSSINLTNSTRVINNLFLNEGLFLRRKNDSLKVKSFIVSSTFVNTSIRNLENPLNVTFPSSNKDDLDESKIICVFWDPTLDEGYGDWSSEGCNLTIINSKLVCICDHLTNFAILLDVSSRTNISENEGQFDVFLEAVSYIGVIISIICIILTLFTYIAAKNLRQTISGQLIINLSFALLGLYVSFILAVHSRHVEIICAASGIILQYFFLVTFLAMGCESVILYRELVIIVGERRDGVALKSALICWILPIFIVLFCFAPNYKNYIHSAFCRAFGIPFYIGTVAPFISIYVFNCFIFTIIMVSLLRRAQSSSAVKLPTHTFAKQQLGVAISLSILFGISWGFGLFASQHVYSKDTKFIRDIFAAVFVVLTSFHGFGLFVMHCVRPKKVRKEILTMFKSKKLIMSTNNEHKENFFTLIRNQNSSTPYKKQRNKTSPLKKNDFLKTNEYDTNFNTFAAETTFMNCEDEENSKMQAGKGEVLDLTSEP